MIKTKDGIWENVEIFVKWNDVNPATTKGYTVFFGNWGTYYANMTKEQLLKRYKVFVLNSRFMSFGDLYLYKDGEWFRSINWQNNYEYIVSKPQKTTT